MFLWSALACLAASVLGVLLLRYSFFADFPGLEIPHRYAVALYCCLILTCPLFLITLKSSKVGSVALWALTVAVAALAAVAGAFGLATPIIALLIFAASVVTSIWHKHRRIVLDDAPKAGESRSGGRRA
jgi:Na+/melibiose symporter-like transporter